MLRVRRNAFVAGMVLPGRRRRPLRSPYCVTTSNAAPGWRGVWLCFLIRPEIQQDEHEAHGSEGEGDDLAREAEGLREAERDEADDEVEGDQNGEDDARDSAALGVQEPVHHDAVSQRRRDEEHGEEHLSPGMAVERREAEGDGARDGADAEGEEIRDRGLAREEREHAGEDDEIEHWERRSDLHDAHGEIRAGELAAIVNAEFHCRTSSSVRRR